MSYRTIMLKSNSLREEAKAGEANIYPGQCLEWHASDTVYKNNTAGAPTTGLMIAVENALQGDEVSDVYTNGARVQFHYAVPGDYFALLIASSENISFGDKITTNNDGDFVEAGSGDTVCAIALEAPGSLAADTLVKCVILAPMYTA